MQQRPVAATPQALQQLIQLVDLTLIKFIAPNATTA
jgi:hypothetical protein